MDDARYTSQGGELIGSHLRLCASQLSQDGTLTHTGEACNNSTLNLNPEETCSPCLPQQLCCMLAQHCSGRTQQECGQSAATWTLLLHACMAHQ